MTVDKWDLKMLGLARHISQWSKDPSTQVGAVLAGPDHRIISVGFNGLPRGIDDNSAILGDRGLKYETIIHAEINAILFARHPLAGATLYTWPFQPCSRCTSVVIQVGIIRVVAPPPLDHWKLNCGIASRLLDEAGVILDITNMEIQA